MNQLWTADDLVFLRRNYGSRTTEWLVEKLAKTEANIEGKARELRLAKSKRRFSGCKMYRWTDAEVAVLRSRYSTRKNLELAHELGRSVKSIISKACKLGLKKDRQRLHEMGLENVALRRGRSRGSV